MPKPVVLHSLPKWILNPNIKMASVVVLYILASFFQTFVLSTIAFPWQRTSMTMCFYWNSLLVRNFLVWIVMSFTMAAHLRAAREEKSWLMSTSLCWTPDFKFLNPFLSPECLLFHKILTHNISGPSYSLRDISRGCKSKIRVPAWQVWSLFQTTDFLLCPRMVQRGIWYF